MFRRLLPVFLLFSSTAAAQGFLCDVPTGTGSPALIRGEGVAEKVNDIVITCTGGTPQDLLFRRRISLSLYTTCSSPAVWSRRLPRRRKRF
jgi:hypothetical protein